MDGRLCDLKPTQSATVKEVLPCALRQRFCDIGIIPGTTIKCLFNAPASDPKAYLVRGAVIAIRNCDASNITIS